MGKELRGLREAAGLRIEEVAERLDVSAASASAMVKRLESMGFVEREPYHGVKLTPAGERVALEVVRHHRLLELYLAEALGMSWDRVHEEAEVLEHAISPALSELIATKLGTAIVRSAIDENIPTATTSQVSLNCPGSERLLSGGGSWSGALSAAATLKASYPVGNSWVVQGTNNSGGNLNFTVWALCLQ